MLDAKTASDLVSDYRFALDVMEENNHLGLDHEYVSNLRDILVRHISKAEAELFNYPATPIRFPVQREKLSA